MFELNKEELKAVLLKLKNNEAFDFDNCAAYSSLVEWVVGRVVERWRGSKHHNRRMWNMKKKGYSLFN